MARVPNHRDLTSPDVRQKYWMGRFQRFYPDFFISSMLAFVLEANPFIRCWTVSGLNWIFNFASLFLLGAWVIWIPGTGYLNGPAWFIVTLAWLWIGFPFFQPQLAAFCRSDSHWQFVFKVLLIWAVSILPGVFFLTLTSYATIDDLVWGVKWCPIFRAAEFVMGVLVAVRVQERNQYDTVGDCSKKDDGSTATAHLDLAGPLAGHLAWCAALFVAALAFHAIHIAQWDPACDCLDLTLRCYGWMQFIDARFAPATAAIIFTVASLDCAAAAENGGDSDTRVGWLGAAVRRGLTYGPIVEVGRAPLTLLTAQLDSARPHAACHVQVERPPRDSRRCFPAAALHARCRAGFSAGDCSSSRGICCAPAAAQQGHALG